MGKVTLRPFLSQFCVTNLDIQGFYPLDCMNLIYRSKDDLSMFLLLELRGIAKVQPYQICIDKFRYHKILKCSAFPENSIGNSENSCYLECG